MGERLHSIDFEYIEALHGVANEMSDEFAFDCAERLLLSGLTEARCSHGGSGDDSDAAKVLCGLGRVHLDRGDYKQAEKKFEESLHLAQGLHGKAMDHIDISNALFHLGRVAFEQGRLDDTKQCYQKSLDMDRRLRGNGNDAHDFQCSLNTSHPLYELANVALRIGDGPAAETLCLENVAMCESLFEQHEVRKYNATVLIFPWRRVRTERVKNSDEKVWN